MHNIHITAEKIFDMLNNGITKMYEQCFTTVICIGIPLILISQRYI